MKKYFSYFVFSCLLFIATNTDANTKQDSVKWFSTMDLSGGFLRTMPVSNSFDISPTIVEKGPYFVKFGVTHSLWMLNFFSLESFQFSLTPGMKIFPFLKLYGGGVLKVNNTGYTLRQMNAYNLYGTLGMEIKVSSHYSLRLDYYQFLYNLTPNIQRYHYLYDFVLGHIIEDNQTLCCGVGLVYNINKPLYIKLQKTQEFQPSKNIFYIHLKTQFPFLGIAYERQLIEINHKYIFSLNVGYRQGAYMADSAYVYAFHIKGKGHHIKNAQLNIVSKTKMLNHIYWNNELALEYFYVVDDGNPSYFNELGLNSGLFLELNKHLQLKLQFHYPLYYFNIHPELRTTYKVVGFKSYFMVGFGYGF